MKLLLKRIYRGQSYSIGHLYINGEYFCDTLEDTDRGLDDSMTLEHIKKLKIYCKTAIPTGTYNVTMNVKSPKYGKIMPRLLNVKGYEGVLIHSGNKAEDSCGCILVGENKVKGKVINSRIVFNKLFKILDDCKEDITIEIK